jgi:nucleoside phosphorylase
MTERDAPIVVVTAVATETRAVLKTLRRVRRLIIPQRRAWQAEIAGRSVRVVQAGIGWERARTALQAMPGPHGLVLSVGFAGALVPGSVAGDVVLPTTIVWESAAGTERYLVPTAAWEAARTQLPVDDAERTLHGPILSSPTIVASALAKREAARRTGAVAVEMEAAGLIAAARGVDVVALRVILDGVDVSLEALPPELDSSWRSRAQLIGRPAAWVPVLALARKIPTASRALTRVLGAVLPRL